VVGDTALTLAYSVRSLTPRTAKDAVMADGIVTLTSGTFDETVNAASTPVVVDFWAEWCGPCKMIGPVIDELSQEYAGKAIIGKVNVEEQGDLAVQFGVRNIPTILFIKNGEVVDKQVGAAPKAALVDMINKHI